MLIYCVTFNLNFAITWACGRELIETVCLVCVENLVDGVRILIKKLFYHSIFFLPTQLRERSQNTYAFRGGGGGQQFFTFLCKNIGICTVLRYEAVKNLEKLRTYFVYAPTKKQQIGTNFPKFLNYFHTLKCSWRANV